MSPPSKTGAAERVRERERGSKTLWVLTIPADNNLYPLKH